MSEASTPPVKLGIIGFGVMGQIHAKHILEEKIKGVELVAVADCDRAQFSTFKAPEKKDAPPSPSRAAFEELDVPLKFESPEELINSGSVDAVLISTPHYSHTTIGIQALEAGLHVMVEKPISVHKKDAERLIAAHTNPGQVFAAMFNQRTNPAFRRIREMLRSGEFGQVHRITWVITDWFRTELYYASGGWRGTWAGEGGGVLLNQCPHQLDLWQWMFGLPSKVTAFCGFGRFHDIEVEDQVTAVLEYENGGVGTFITTTGEAPGSNRLEIAADGGRIVFENKSNKIYVEKNEVLTSRYLVESEERFGNVPFESSTIEVDGTGGQHVEVLQNFIDAISGETELIAPAAEGRASVELANAMLYSGFTGGTVELPLDADAYAKVLEERIASSKPKKRVVNVAAKTDDFGSSQ